MIVRPSCCAWLACICLTDCSPRSATHAAGEPSSPYRALQAAALSSSRGLAFVRAMTREVGARPAGSDGDRRAVAWALAALPKYGLTNVHAEPVTVPHWERGTLSVTARGHGALDAAALGGSVGTPPGGIEAEVVAVRSLEDLASRDPEEIHGKIVFFTKRMTRSRDGAGYGDGVGIRFDGALRASEKGAVGVLLRSVSADDSAPHTGAMRRDETIRAVPAAALSGVSADRLEAALLVDKGLRVSFASTSSWSEPSASSNVVGEIVGSERPLEIVLLGAHLDSWDLAEGALDDGAGCAIVTEAARLISELPTRPRRTIRVVLFAAEESSGAGSKGYAAAHAAEASRIVLALEADLGTDPVYLLTALVGPDKASLVGPMADQLKPLHIDFGAKPAHGGSDVSPLRKLGVPVVDLHQDATTYFDLHHTRNDTFEHINERGLRQATAAFATVALYASELPSDFGRIPEESRNPPW